MSNFQDNATNEERNSIVEILIHSIFSFIIRMVLMFGLSAGVVVLSYLVDNISLTHSVLGLTTSIAVYLFMQKYVVFKRTSFVKLVQHIERILLDKINRGQ